MIQATMTLNDHQLLEKKALVPSVRSMTGLFGILISPICSILIPDMPAFFLYYEKVNLLTLLTVYADDPVKSDENEGLTKP